MSHETDAQAHQNDIDIDMTEAATANLISGEPDLDRRSSTTDSQEQSSDSTSYKPTTSEKHEARKTRIRWPSLWAWELAAATFSIICLGLIFAVVAAIDQRAISVWTLPISPNALIAILSTFSKSSVLLVLAECIGQLKWIYFQQRAHRLKDFSTFDNASRGPWGALELLVKIRWKAAAASIGCLLTLTSLAMEPFAQQVLSYRVKSIPKYSSSATMHTTRVYIPGLGVEMDTMKLLYESLFSTPEDYTCNSDSCEWSNFATLEVCNTCVDVSDSLRITECHEYSVEGGNYAKCNYKFPNPPPYDEGIDANVAIGGGGQTLLNTSATEIDITSMAPDYIARINILNLPYTPGLSNASVNLHKPNALQCTFTWCSRWQYVLYVVNGTVENDQRQTDEILFVNGYIPDHLPTRYTQLSPGFASGNYSGKNITAYPGRNISHELIRHFVDTIAQQPEDSRTFLVDTTASFSIGANIVELFGPGAISLAGRGDYYGSGLDLSSELGKLMYEKHNKNHTKTMDDYAAALTHAVKRSANSTVLQGAIKQQRTYVRVFWAWLTLPALVVLLSTTFLFVSISFSLEQGQVVWKTSAIASLFHGLRGWSDGTLSNAHTYWEMERSSRLMWGRLAEDDERGFLIQREDS